jgi:hypothetical protein
MKHPKFVQLVSLGYANSTAGEKDNPSIPLRRDALMALADDGSVWHWLGHEWHYLCNDDGPSCREDLPSLKVACAGETINAAMENYVKVINENIPDSAHYRSGAADKARIIQHIRGTAVRVTKCVFSRPGEL